MGKKTDWSNLLPRCNSICTWSCLKLDQGKIMRRILRKIAANEHDQLGDTTTLADPSVVQSLVDNRKNI